MGKNVEISSLLEKAVIVESTHEPGEFISSVFVRLKKGGSHRMILNLKNLNKHVHKVFCTVMRPNCFIYSLNRFEGRLLLCVPIAPSHQKYLKFEWDGRLYRFPCFPNGLAFCPRKFTKLYEASLRYFETAWTRRDANQLLIGYEKPHKPVLTNTISRWNQRRN